SRRRGAVKAVLMDQRFVAGVGNLLADEILWQAGIHPRRRVETLSSEDRQRLLARLRLVVRESVRSYDYVSSKRRWLSHVRGWARRCSRTSLPRRRRLLGRTGQPRRGPADRRRVRLSRSWVEAGPSPSRRLHPGH